jgi:hypothetical protein
VDATAAAHEAETEAVGVEIAVDAAVTVVDHVAAAVEIAADEDRAVGSRQ